MVLSLSLGFSLAAFAAERPLAERFAQPEPGARIFKIIHGWPDQPAAQDNLIRRLKQQGFGGVVCNVSFDQYLESEPKWNAFVRAVNEARRAGLALWLYDERGYPSGNAGGLVMRDHPEWEARGLLIANQETGAGPVEITLPPGKLVLAAAFPVRQGEIDLGGRVELVSFIREGKLRWQAPAGRWHVMAVTESRLYEGTHADGNLWQKMPYINLLLPEPTKLFLDVTHQRYADHLGGDLGKHFVATFTDEPSLMSVFLKPMPYRPLPWAQNLPGEFKVRRGYALDTNLIPALIADAGSAGQKFRYDFWLTVGELVSQNFFGQIQERCRQLNIPSGGHLLMEEGLVAHVPFYGDFFRCARRLDAPSIDCLTSLPSEVPWYIARLVASAAALEGKSLVMCETSDHGQVWRPPGDQRPKRIVTEAEIRGTCNRLLVAGVNRITSYYSFSGLGDEQLQRLNDWVGRCGAALTGGRQVADLALVYPVESLWTKFTPARHWANEAPAAAKIESTYRAALENLFAAQRDFTIVDSRTLAEAKADAGALTRGELRWRVVVLPRVDTLPLAAWENLARFVRVGGVAIALGALPTNSETEFPSARVRGLAKEMFGAAHASPLLTTNAAGGAGIYLPAGSEALLPLVLRGVLKPEVSVSEARSPLRVTHRRNAGHELFFAINDSPKPWSGTVRLAAKGAGERWNPATGERAPVATNTVALSLEAYGACVLQFAAADAPRRLPISGGALPNLTLRSLPAVPPGEGHGEFVRATLSRDTNHSAAGVPVWRAHSQITKSDVDTFLFILFPQPQPLDLSAADCLAIDTWVPEGQQTPSQILVILREEGGGDFIANTGRSLAAAGHERSFVPMSQFQHAGWSKDADGVLDLKRVREVRIGWGGYLGQAGETVQFSVALPQLGAVAR